MKTNKLLTALFAAFTLGTGACAQKANTQETPKDTKMLIAYFSASGTTAGVAQKLADVTGGDLYEITPETPYTSEDLNWRNEQSRSSVEMKDPQSRPTIKGKKENMADYDVVFIGYPIWWGVAPTIVNTFIEDNDLNGKTLIVFATSGGSSISKSIDALKQTYPSLNWKDGKLLNRPSDSTIRSWIKELGL